ncbi:hypothetical protein ABZ654_34590 [Streptomyces hygroscopicus]|uniref:hypothetical protein n=1 Tax=Streptomyces hygroscopicus TaxID=1912 RepID=UPI0034103BC7
MNRQRVLQLGVGLDLLGENRRCPSLRLRRRPGLLKIRQCGPTSIRRPQSVSYDLRDSHPGLLAHCGCCPRDHSRQDTDSGRGEFTRSH